MISLPLLLLLLLQSSTQAPTAYAVLAAEYARPDDVSVLIAGTKSDDVQVRAVAVRAMGRLERPELKDAVVPFTRDSDVEVRREAIGALAQMKAPFDFVSLLSGEKSPAVRAVIYESIGRAKPPLAGAEGALVAGLGDQGLTGRTGAARGIETWVRVNGKTMKAAPSTLEALRRAFRENAASDLRQFALLALNASADQDAATFDLALKDPDPQVRRLAVVGSKRWIDDPSAIVRVEAMRVAGTCDRAFAGVGDSSGHVALAAVDLLGTQKCDAAKIDAIVTSGASWRIRSHALVSLAKVSPELARPRVAIGAKDPVWQARAYAATAAKLINDEATLAVLASDSEPNVAAAALDTVEQAMRALSSAHSGLLLAAAAKLKGRPEADTAAPKIVAAIQRLTSPARSSARDARVKLIELLEEVRDPAVLEPLRPLLSDRDPAVAEAAAKVLTARTGKVVAAITKTFVPEPFPSEAALRSLTGATASIRMKSLGDFKLTLVPEDAPATVAAFAALADRKAYDGLTFHRVVPNFVLQGGSPGADEYDPLASHFMRDELGFASNARGTFGVSTRGHDTGDGQIFVNLIDNWRLDHIYTVFASVASGMDVVDRILEGDVIEKVTIQRGR